MSGIIVGLDESTYSGHALRWAMHEAVLRHVPLTVMAVLPNQVRPATEIYWGLSTYSQNSISSEDRTSREEDARMAAQAFVDKVASEIGETVPEITVSVVTGNPAEELVNASRDADMLVVGSRGSGGFGSLLMGSVSSQVVHHAVCAVLVVPATR